MWETYASGILGGMLVLVAGLIWPPKNYCCANCKKRGTKNNRLWHMKGCHPDKHLERRRSARSN